MINIAITQRLLHVGAFKQFLTRNVRLGNCFTDLHRKSCLFWALHPHLVRSAFMMKGLVQLRNLEGVFPRWCPVWLIELLRGFLLFIQHVPNQSKGSGLY
ncbi:hypothetical protein N7G274_004648 [Stereocaulon virgatum]|uniref:Uncharacterized protein n=1 Tax=Stereocaulon virgatum TaxID=373712 RepID=A0ABR4ACU5_9LECA